MFDFTNIQYHNPKSKTLVCILPGARGSCDSKSQLMIFDTIVSYKISCININYYHQDSKEGFTMSDNFKQKESILYEQIIGFRNNLDTQQYNSIILIGNSLGGLLWNKLIPVLQINPSKLIILGYLTGYIEPDNIQCPTIIIQGEYDKYGGIDIVKQDLQQSIAPIEYHEIANADHAYYDHRDPNTRYLDQVIQIINNIIQGTNI